MRADENFRSGEKDGLHELVLAAGAHLAERDGAVGLLALSAEASAEHGPSVTIEAEFGYRDGKRILGGLEVRAKSSGDLVRSGDNRSAWLRDTIQHFGGTRVVNLWLGKDGAEALDVTVSFGSKIPFFAENLLLSEDAPTEEEARKREAVLRALGVRARREERAVSVPRRELRTPMALDDELRAYATARDAGYDVALYSASIPCTQALRVAETAGDPTTLDVVLSRGLTPSYTCTSADAHAMERALAPLGVRFGGRTYTLEHSLGNETPERESKPRGLKWFQMKKRR